MTSAQSEFERVAGLLRSTSISGMQLSALRALSGSYYGPTLVELLHGVIVGPVKCRCGVRVLCQIAKDS
jgi:hypothetical protein